MSLDLLIHDAPLRNADMRKLIPATILDAFLYAEHDGRAYAAIWPPDDVLVEAVRPDVELLNPFALGLNELIEGGMEGEEALAEVALRVCQRIGIRRAAVPRRFPLQVADRLRAGGVELIVDGALFDARRRAKGPVELAGIRRASRAAAAGMGIAASMIWDAVPDAGGALHLDGEPLTAERIHDALRGEFDRHGCQSTDVIVAPGAQGASCHDLGSGPIHAGVPVICDLWPQDRASGCWSDMTRTFVNGTLRADVERWHALCLEVHDRVLPVLAPGVTGQQLWEVACDVMEAAGELTQRDPGGRDVLRDGFFHSLGHGVGLEVHEQPLLGRGGEALVPGDVVTVEPGVYREGDAGVRVEDLFLITDDGWERLTSYPMDLSSARDAGRE
jgi:Xaa-Pro aminopeptidase